MGENLQDHYKQKQTTKISACVKFNASTKCRDFHRKDSQYIKYFRWRIQKINKYSYLTKKNQFNYLFILNYHPLNTPRKSQLDSKSAQKVIMQGLLPGGVLLLSPKMAAMLATTPHSLH